jgi:hypothetical protein
MSDFADIYRGRSSAYFLVYRNLYISKLFNHLYGAIDQINLIDKHNNVQMIDFQNK